MAVNTLISPTEPMIKPWDVCPSNGLKKKKGIPCSFNLHLSYECG